MANTLQVDWLVRITGLYRLFVVLSQEISSRTHTVDVCLFVFFPIRKNRLNQFDQLGFFQNEKIDLNGSIPKTFVKGKKSLVWKIPTTRSDWQIGF